MKFPMKVAYLPVLLLMEHFFGLYGIAFAGAATLVFSLTAGIFFSLRWNQSMQPAVCCFPDEAAENGSLT